VNYAALANFSRDDLIALVLAQHAQIAAQAEQISALSARLATLEAKLAAPPKTPDNSSLPPSKGQKPNLPDSAVMIEDILNCRTAALSGQVWRCEQCKSRTFSYHSCVMGKFSNGESACGSLRVDLGWPH
jgi:hypothetical protein